MHYVFFLFFIFQAYSIESAALHVYYTDTYETENVVYVKKMYVIMLLNYLSGTTFKSSIMYFCLLSLLPIVTQGY